MRFSIGEFSLITSLSIKSLRLYHEKGIESIIKFEKENTMDKNREFQVEEKELDTILIAGHRMRGKYQGVGKGLAFVCKKMGRHANGKPMTLYYDGEYKEDDADFEPCIPVRKGKDAEGISIRELKGGPVRFPDP